VTHGWVMARPNYRSRQREEAEITTVRQKWPLGVAGHLSPRPLGWIVATPKPLGVDRNHPQWPDLSLLLFFRRKSHRRWVVGGSIWAGGPLFGCLIGCFVLILGLCIFLKMLRCQLVSGGQKTPPLCNDRIATALIFKFFTNT
jgi:hypothetical protein